MAALRYLLTLVLLWTSLSALAGQGMLMARSSRPAETVMEELQAALKQSGYAIAHIQKCDGGMAEFGYKSDFYRVIFFGKADQVRELVKRVPEMAAYLPLKIVVFAEREDTVMAAIDPLDLPVNTGQDPELTRQLEAWRDDIRRVLERVRSAQ